MTSGVEWRGWRELFWNLTQRELKGKYKRTALGQLWSLGNPLALMLVYTFVFAFVFQQQIAPGNPSGVSAFPLWLLAGLLPWIFLSNAVQQGLGSIVEHEALIQKVYFRRNVLVLSKITSLAISWAIEMGVLTLALVIVGAWRTLVLAPVILVFMALLTLFAAGIAMMASIANAYFRDTQYLATILFQLGMYLSPVIYPIALVERVSDDTGPLFAGVTVSDIYKLNPVQYFLGAFRTLMYDNRLPGLGTWVVCVVLALVSFAIGWRVFSKYEKRLAEIL